MSSLSAAAPPLQHPRPRWTAATAPDDRVAILVAELRLPPALCRLLVQRGYDEPSMAREYLRPHRGQIHPPGEMAGVADAVARLRSALSRGETILVHGDYDVDGICATALLVRVFSLLGARAVPFVPHRIRDGYDLTDAGLRAAREAGATVIVTVDCGIAAGESVLRARSAGIDVIITDHHTPPPQLPSAAAVLNPNRPDCLYPFKGLAGVGVAFKLASALASDLGFPEERMSAFLDLVALATVADLAPLTGENRALVRWGLSVLARTPNPGLRALLEVTRLAGGGEITASQVGYVLAPRLNAIGRLGDAMLGVRLLLTDDEGEAASLALRMEEANRARRDADEQTLRQALGMIEVTFDPSRDHGVVLASAGWHPGVIGIVASRVVERIHRPTVLVALAGEEGRGSARSIPGFHLYEAFSACSGHLVRFGGHRAAAGCSLLASEVEPFRRAFDAHARQTLTPDLLTPQLRIDGELGVADATAELVRLLKHFGPFGVGNPTPVFAARGVRVETPRIVGNQHLKVSLRQGSSRLDGIGFGMGERAGELSGAVADVAFKLEENTWTPGRGGPPRTSLQARLMDFRVSG